MVNNNILKRYIQKYRDLEIDMMQFTDNADEDEEYEYDANGSMTNVSVERGQSKLVCYAEREKGSAKLKDLNSNISSVQYNCLNLPKKIYFTNRNVMEYVYNTDGELVQMSARTLHQLPLPRLDTKYYAGNAVYLLGHLSKLLTDEGYVTFTSGGTPVYHYYLRDHLGNVRVVFTGGFLGVIEQRNDYYPSGALMASSTDGSVQPYKYNFSIERGKRKLACSSEREKNRQKVNGKELERMNGLDLYDYGARYMDGALGRFTTIDPLCEKYYGISPYAYCAGNPVNAIDIHGDSITFVGNSDDKNYSISVLNNSLGFDYVQMDGNGILSENMRSSLVSYVMMNKCQEQLFKMLRKCINAPGGMTTIGLVNNSEDVIIGSAALKQIDVGDIQAISNHTQDKLPFNPTGALSHEIFEQYLIQQKGVDVDTAHRQASGAESIIVGSHIPPNRMIEGNTLNINIFDLRNQERMTYSIKVQLNNNNITNIVHKSF